MHNSTIVNTNFTQETSLNRGISRKQICLEKKYCKNDPPGDQPGSQLAEKLSHPSTSVQSKIAALYGRKPQFNPSRMSAVTKVQTKE